MYQLPCMFQGELISVNEDRIGRLETGIRQFRLGKFLVYQCFVQSEQYLEVFVVRCGLLLLQIIIVANNYWAYIVCQAPSKHFKCMYSFNPHCTYMRQVLL